MERDAFSKEISELESSQYFVGPTPTVARTLMNIRCGFIGFGPGIYINADVLRDTIRRRAVDERAKWFTAAGQVIGERIGTQFKFLLTYYLSAESKINPTHLEALIASAINPTISYNNLLTPQLDAINDNQPALHANLRRPIRDIATNLLGGILHNTDPKYQIILNLIINAIRLARKARLDQDAWSAVFVVSVIRRSAIELKLEAMNGILHEGMDRLLKGGVGHRHYTYEAYQRGTGRTMGTYNAFQINTRTPQVGDIIIQDRQAQTIGNVLQFGRIPQQLAPGMGRELHGDIVVEARVGSNFVVTIGGNVGNSVRHRRYPLDHNRRLITNAGQLYTQENVAGNLPNIPASIAAPAAAQLNSQSTGRIFALLSPVEECHTFPCY
jgi:hypothetical protein